MAIFFDIGTDSDLLHSSIRNEDELYSIVDRVEWEITQAFKQREMQGLSTYSDFFLYESGSQPNTEIKVRLLGYDQDDPENSEDGLKEVFKYTIADVVSWVLRNYNNQQSAENISLGRFSVSTSGDVPTWREFPSGWDRRFKNYDARITEYGI